MFWPWWSLEIYECKRWDVHYWNLEIQRLIQLPLPLVLASCGLDMRFAEEHACLIRFTCTNYEACIPARFCMNLTFMWRMGVVTSFCAVTLIPILDKCPFYIGLGNKCLLKCLLLVDWDFSFCLVDFKSK